jgi:hypothetical protein
MGGGGEPASSLTTHGEEVGEVSRPQCCSGLPIKDNAALRWPRFFRQPARSRQRRPEPIAATAVKRAVL